jgi:hypothetical protein
VWCCFDKGLQNACDDGEGKLKEAPGWCGFEDVLHHGQSPFTFCNGDTKTWDGSRVQEKATVLHYLARRRELFGVTQKTAIHGQIKEVSERFIGLCRGLPVEEEIVNPSPNLHGWSVFDFQYEPIAQFRVKAKLQEACPPAAGPMGSLIDVKLGFELAKKG